MGTQDASAFFVLLFVLCMHVYPTEDTLAVVVVVVVVAFSPTCGGTAPAHVLIGISGADNCGRLRSLPNHKSDGGFRILYSNITKQVDK